MYTNKQDIHSTLQQISDILLINGTFVGDSGLYTGKMGIALFFFRYAQYTQNELYSEYGFHLFEKIQNDIYQEAPLNYKQGLTGIGSTIEYLVQNFFFESDTDEILEDFDKRIFFTYSLSNLPIDTIADIGYYALWRLSGNSTKKDTIFELVIPQIVNIMDRFEITQNTENPIVPLFRNVILHRNHNRGDNWPIIINWFQLYLINNENNFGNSKLFMDLLERFHTNSKNLDLGLQNGLARLGLSLISKLDSNDSWLSLLPYNLIPGVK